ncbi:hypothetical protein FC093_00285 [Ilyomonas limi]|uniref:Uncharacterized protein n=1 Tax=Ilyomonas limi TaxID=2575867 RepID=A0A4U3L8A9_9BACT|nr:hypothetical protein [Ilyomonas limi]TKK71498.1 hypothetical protein FC093_00285 [Ilyomonas limi]
MPRKKAAVVELAGSTEKFLNKFVAEKEQAQWCTEQLQEEGPDHKQVMNALLLNSLQPLVKEIEKLSGAPFILQKGEEIYGIHPEHLQEIPVPFPIPANDTNAIKKITKVIAQAPDNEILVYALLAQITQWGTKALKKAGKEMAANK